MRWVGQRRLFTFAAAVVLVASGLIIDSSSVFAAKPGSCPADLAITAHDVSLDGLAGGIQLYVTHVQFTNFGPCNVHDATLTVDFDPATVVYGIRINPSGWTCTQPPATFPDVSCTSTASTGVPSTVDLSMTISHGDLQNTATVTGSTDLYHDNDTSTAAFIPEGSPTSSPACVTTSPAFPCFKSPSGGQNAQFSVPGNHSGFGSGSIQQFQGGNPNSAGPLSGLPICPASVPNCFGKYVSFLMPTFTTTNCSFDTPENCVKKFFVYDASAPGVPSFGQLKLFHATTLTGPYTEAPRCARGVPLPCIFDITRTKSAGGSSLFIIGVIVDGPDDSWLG